MPPLEAQQGRGASRRVGLIKKPRPFQARLFNFDGRPCGENHAAESFSRKKNSRSLRLGFTWIAEIAFFTVGRTAIGWGRRAIFMVDALS